MGVGANTESIADHMLRMQYICMTVEDPALDMNR
jgi:5'-deoxynucleotidase YfbR-like HD superfamily hydrolase